MSQTVTENCLSVQRLKDRSDFLRARRGTKAHTSSFVLQLVRGAETGGIRIGYTVTKKTGNAVERNRIKRRLREAIRQMSLPQSLCGHDAVFIGRREALDIPFQTLISDITNAFDKALKKQPEAPNTVAIDGHTGQNRSRNAPVASPPKRTAQS